MPRWTPLDWPEGQLRTETQDTARFKVSFDKALQGLRRELRLMGATSVCVSTNLELARDGWPDPRSKLKRNDPGVSVYWMLGGKMHVIACDAWDRVEDNLHAVALTLSADRGKARWRCSGVLDRSIAAYLALPAPTPKTPWWEILGVRKDDPLPEIEMIWKARVRAAHPDQGGSHDRITELNRAIEDARKEKSYVAKSG